VTIAPRVVGLMPTLNRPAMAHRAVHLLLEQEYEGPMHLLVFDDGDRPVVGCSTCRPHFELIRSPAMKLPTKRNAMMEHVGDRDAIYFMWDDDDYHGPHRVARQVSVVSHQPAPACILRPTLYYNSITNDLRVSRWISDATVAFTWEFWNRRRFDERIDPGSGLQFVKHRDVEEIPGDLDYMTVVHAGQRHTPPAFGLPDFYEAPVPASWAAERLAFR
jgi:hypothetical protein